MFLNYWLCCAEESASMSRVHDVCFRLTLGVSSERLNTKLSSLKAKDLKERPRRAFRVRRSSHHTHQPFKVHSGLSASMSEPGLPCLLERSHLAPMNAQPKPSRLFLKPQLRYLTMRPDTAPQALPLP